MHFIAIEVDSVVLHHLSRRDQVSLRHLRLELEERCLPMVPVVKPKLVVGLLVEYLGKLFLL